MSLRCCNRFSHKGLRRAPGVIARQSCAGHRTRDRHSRTQLLAKIRGPWLPKETVILRWSARRATGNSAAGLGIEQAILRILPAGKIATVPAEETYAVAVNEVGVSPRRRLPAHVPACPDRRQVLLFPLVAGRVGGYNCMELEEQSVASSAPQGEGERADRSASHLEPPADMMSWEREAPWNLPSLGHPECWCTVMVR